LTLVEAIAGIALLGTLLATVLLSIGRIRTQDARAAQRIEACRIAEDLLQQLWAKADKFPRGGDGEVSGKKGWRWRTQAVANPQAQNIRGEVVAVEVLAPGSDAGPPAARVEIVLPTTRPAKTGTGTSKNATTKRSDVN
jgi:type II secretory pathway pseudopilin PulG